MQIIIIIILLLIQHGFYNINFIHQYIDKTRIIIINYFAFFNKSNHIRINFDFYLYDYKLNRYSLGGEIFIKFLY